MDLTVAVNIRSVQGDERDLLNEESLECGNDLARQLSCRNICKKRGEVGILDDRTHIHNLDQLFIGDLCQNGLDIHIRKQLFCTDRIHDQRNAQLFDQLLVGIGGADGGDRLVFTDLLDQRDRRDDLCKEILYRRISKDLGNGDLAVCHDQKSVFLSDKVEERLLYEQRARIEIRTKCLCQRRGDQRTHDRISQKRVAHAGISQKLANRFIIDELFGNIVGHKSLDRLVIQTCKGFIGIHGGKKLLVRHDIKKHRKRDILLKDKRKDLLAQHRFKEGRIGKLCRFNAERGENGRNVKALECRGQPLGKKGSDILRRYRGSLFGQHLKAIRIDQE